MAFLRKEFECEKVSISPLFLRQKSTNLKCKYKKAARETFAVHKMLVKLTAGGGVFQYTN